jgi:hypothetical protein
MQTIVNALFRGISQFEVQSCLLGYTVKLLSTDVSEVRTASITSET